MMEFEEEHEEEEMALTPTFKSGGGNDKKPGTTAAAARYRECLKNHAVGKGGHAVDGCGEFMPAGVEGTLDALKCAACNCHRNFHRKELIPLHNQQLTIYTSRPQYYHQHQHQHHPQPVYNFYPYNRTTATTPTPSPTGYLHVPPLSLPSPTGGGGGVRETTADGGGGGGMNIMGSSGMTITTTSSSGKKRFRTKFTQEQKDKMMDLGERVGWRIQKQDDAVVQLFCNDTGVKRHVLKVWMHNNKHTVGKKP